MLRVFSEYTYGATRISWGPERLTLYQRWTPFQVEIPFVVLTSHHILYNKGVKDSHNYNCDEFVSSLEYCMVNCLIAVTRLAYFFGYFNINNKTKVIKQLLNEQPCTASSSAPSIVKPTVEFREETIIIENYVNVASALYNKNWLGFQLDRKQTSVRINHL